MTFVSMGYRHREVQKRIREALLRKQLEAYEKNRREIGINLYFITYHDLWNINDFCNSIRSSLCSDHLFESFSDTKTK